MSAKFLLFVLGTLLLVQCALANVIDEKTVPAESISPDAAAIEYFNKNQFTWSSLVDKTYDFSQSLLEPTVGDITVTDDVTKTPLQTKFEELKEYFEKSKNLVADDEHKNKNDFIHGLFMMLVDIKETEKTTSSFSAFETSVLNAIESFKSATFKEVDTVATQLVADAEHFWEEMGDERRHENEEFHVSTLKLKNETDYKKKAELIQTVLDAAN